MENPEQILLELNSLERAPLEELTKGLEEYLVFVARTGNTVFPWTKIKPVVRLKLETIIADFSKDMPEEQSLKMPNVDMFKFPEMKQRIFEQLDSYSGIPFTMQRLCELLTQPRRHYKRVDKFMRGLEKVMLVVSTVEPLAAGEDREKEAQANGSRREEEEATNGRREEERRERSPVREGREEEEMSLESPSKRIRLSSAEEEGGPCDSQDGVNQAAKAVVGSEEGAGPSGLAAPLEGEEESMDIDTECTSSQARLLVPAAADLPEASGESPCDSGDTGVTTSAAPAAAPPAVVAEVEEGVGAAQPSSTEGAPPCAPATDQEPGVEAGRGAAPDCSSSDQAAVADRNSASPTNSEAEPAGEVPEQAEPREEVPPVQEQEESPPASVQSSEEVRSGGEEGEAREVEGAGMADSSDEARAGVEVAVEAGEQKEQKEWEDTSPDQSDTA